MPHTASIVAAIIAVFLAGTAGAQPVEPGKEGELLNFLPAKPGSKICYARTYSVEHLAAHPRQKVTGIEFRLTYYKHDPEKYFPQGQRNYYFALLAKLRGNGKRLKSFGECVPAKDGISCNVECDGGGIKVKRRPDGKALVYFADADSYIRMTEGCDEDEENGIDLKPGTDDKEFLLSKTADAACSGYDNW